LRRLPEDGGLPEEVIATIIQQTLRGLEYLHSHGHIHRDVKASNLLLDGMGCVRIADLGVTGWMDDITSRQRKDTLVGTPCWMAPEVLQAEKVGGYDSKADLWSVGITAMELARGLPPYANLTAMDIVVRTISRPPPTFDSYSDIEPRTSVRASSAFTSFLQACLVKNPRERKSATELLGHKFLKGAKVSALVALLGNVPKLGVTVPSRLEYQEYHRVDSVCGDPVAVDLSMTPFIASSTPRITDAATLNAPYTPNTTWFFPDTVSGDVVDTEAARAAAQKELDVCVGEEPDSDCD